MSEFAHPFDICVCARCGPPWRETHPEPRDLMGKIAWRSFMALCPICGSKRCPGAMDHDRHVTDKRTP